MEARTVNEELQKVKSFVVRCPRESMRYRPRWVDMDYAHMGWALVGMGGPGSYGSGPYGPGAYGLAQVF